MENKNTSQEIIPIERIESSIYVMRGQKIMLDADLAELYQVETKVLVQAVQRNRKRFPDDFMFQLDEAENHSLRSQIVTSNEGRGGRRYLPYAFTEHGVAMLSSVLRSERAVQMNILIIRAFMKLRELLATHKDLARKIEELENNQEQHSLQINSIIKLLMKPDKKSRKPFGFAKT